MLSVKSISYKYLEQHKKSFFSWKSQVETRDIIKDISFDIKKGEVLALLGRSGSGKTTISSLICGFKKLNDGQISLNDKNISDLPPSKRNIGVVFQESNLFPHMTVEENLYYVLFEVSESKKLLVENLLIKLDLVGLELYYPYMLSKGQKKKVEVLRTLISSPDLLIMDEAFSNIDVFSRARVREEIMAVIKEFNIPMLFITHDPVEALEIANQIVVIDKKSILQYSSVVDIYYRPINLFIAKMFGDVLKVSYAVNDNAFDTEFGVIKTNQIQTYQNYDWEQVFSAQKDFLLVIRPEYIQIKLPTHQVQGQKNQYKLEAKVDNIIFSGNMAYVVLLSSKGDAYKVMVMNNVEYGIGDKVVLELDLRGLFLTKRS